MNVVKTSLHNMSDAADIRMGIRYAKLHDALFFRRYTDDVNIRIKDICLLSKGTSITEDDAEPGSVPVVAAGRDLAYYHNESNRKAPVITVSASGAYAGFINYWEIPIWASDCTTIVSKDETKYNTKFLYYLLKLVQEDVYLMQKGTDQPHVYLNDIQYICVPNISIERQLEILDKIAPLENQENKLRENFLSVQNVIDDVFHREFGYDYEKFEEHKSHKLYVTKQAVFSNNPDLRFSAKFHRPAGEFVMKQLTAVSDKKIKHFLAEPIMLGASVSPDDYDEFGTYSYISMATIKNWSFDQGVAEIVSDSYAAKKILKTVHKDDILLVRSGEGAIGKVAIITNDVDGIFSDFTMRIRLKDYRPRFAYYYFRTTFFQYLIEIYKKGLGNNTNIFPIVIQELPVPDIPLSEQDRIVKSIQVKIDKQSKVKEQIASLRQQIDQIITEAIG